MRLRSSAPRAGPLRAGTGACCGEHFLDKSRVLGATPGGLPGSCQRPRGPERQGRHACWGGVGGSGPRLPEGPLGGGGPCRGAVSGA